MGKYVKNYSTKSQALSDNSLVTSNVLYCDENEQVVLTGDLVKDRPLSVSSDTNNDLVVLKCDEYLTFDIYSGGTISNIGTFTGDTYYSLNGGEWTSLGTSVISVNVGDKVRFKGLYNAMMASETTYRQFAMTSTVKAHGNVTSLLNNDLTKVSIINEGGLRNLFKGCTTLLTAPDIIAKYIYRNGCNSMFEGCSSLTTCPKIDVMCIYPYGCANMFKNCGIVNGGELVATNVGSYGYSSMYYGCSALTSTTETLPALLSGVSQYEYMYYGCTSLINGPRITATRITNSACSHMYDGCTSLKYAQCMCCSYNDLNFSDWLEGTASGGRFSKRTGVKWDRDDDGIPQDWYVFNEGEQFGNMVVDLRLPSGNLWCRNNLCANYESDEGRYFAWKMIEGFKPTEIAGKFYEDWYYSFDGMGGKFDDEANLPKYYLDERFTVPSWADVQELLDNVYIEKTTINGKAGFRFSSKQDPTQYIFFPYNDVAQNGGFQPKNSVFIMSNYVYPDYSEYRGTIRCANVIIQNGRVHVYTNIPVDFRSGLTIRPIIKNN